MTGCGDHPGEIAVDHDRETVARILVRVDSDFGNEPAHQFVRDDNLRRPGQETIESFEQSVVDHLEIRCHH